MKKAFKIIVTIIIVLYIPFSFLLDTAIGASSHNIPFKSREDAERHLYISLVVGVIFIILIWLPWKRILNNNS
ncbi:hypothetical protein [Sporocytophaga myxococcoides]|uniref:hypothetical protein n=1 Tax=Sporocytophaga myxococcoides TaxID=153721 RepID=UPI0003F597C6|nr:hypothetical protein [Sporocytophaga myxococcoides]